MSTNKRLTLEERKQIEQLIADGLSNRKISEEIGRTHNTISKEIRELGGKENYDAIAAHEAALKRWDVRSGRLRIEFTDEQKEVIELGLTKGWTCSRLRYAVGCTYSKMQRYLAENNLRGKDREKPIGFEERISCLEDQVKILTEQLKDILCQK